MFKNRPWNVYYTLGLLNVHCGAVAALFFRPQAVDLALGVGGYLWFGFASTLLYHRSLTHRSYDLWLPLKLFLLLGGLIGLSGDPIRWAATHRYHHQRPDRDDDIHSPRDGWWYAHSGWLARMDMKQMEKILPLAADLARVPYLRIWQNRVLEVLPHLLYTALLVAWRGPRGVYWGLYIPVVLTFHFTWMSVASFCHMPGLGSRRSNTPDASRNVWWLGLPSLGESYHNNHHASPRRARHGQARWDLDPTGLLVWLLERAGLARNVFWDRPRGDDVLPEELPEGVMQLQSVGEQDGPG